MEWDEPTIAAIRSLEQDLGLPPGFIDALGDEDDWSFIIKAQALVEAALAHAVAVTLGRPELDQMIADMSPSWKLDYAHALALVDGREKACISAVFGLRNRLVHDIRNVSFDLKKHFESAREQIQTNLGLAFHPFREQNDHYEIEGKKLRAADVCRILLKVSPKRCIHQAVVMVVAVLTMRRQLDQSLRSQNLSVVEFARRLGPALTPALVGLIDAAPTDTSAS